MLLSNMLDPTSYVPLISAESLKDAIIKVVSYVSGAASSPMVNTTKIVMEFTASDGNFVSQIVSNVTGPFGFMLMVIYFVVALIQDSSSGKELTAMDFARPAFWLIVADVILTNMGPILSSLMGLSNLAAQTAIDAMTDNNVLANTIEDIADADGLLAAANVLKLIVQLVLSVIQWIIQLIAALILFIVLWSSKMELLIRLSFSPIGLASFADESQKNSAIHYLKKLVASAFYYAATIAAISFALQQSVSLATQSMARGYTYDESTGKVVQSGALDNFADSFITAGLMRIEAVLYTAIAPFAAVGLVSAAKSAVNEAFGV